MTRILPSLRRLAPVAAVAFVAGALLVPATPAQAATQLTLTG